MKRIGYLGAALGALVAAGFASALSGTPGGPDWHQSDAARAEMDVDIVDLPPQVTPPGPGDTDWPWYNRTPDGKRFSPLTLIDESNVGELREVCRVRVSGPGPFSAGTILADTTQPSGQEYYKLELIA